MDALQQARYDSVLALPLGSPQRKSAQRDFDAGNQRVIDLKHKVLENELAPLVKVGTKV